MGMLLQYIDVAKGTYTTLPFFNYLFVNFRIKTFRKYVVYNIRLNIKVSFHIYTITVTVVLGQQGMQLV